MRSSSLPEIGDTHQEYEQGDDHTYKTRPQEVKLRSTRESIRNSINRDLELASNDRQRAHAEQPNRFAGTKEDYLRIINELEKKEAELIECQRIYEEAAKANAKRIKKAEKKKSKALEKYASCHSQCIEAEAEVSRLESLMSEVTMLISIFEDSIEKQKPYRECIEEASVRLNDVPDPEILIMRYEATEAKGIDTLKKYDKMMDEKTRRTSETQELVHMKKQQIAQLRSKIIELTKQLQLQNGEASEKKQLQQQLEQQLVKQKVVNGELYAAIENIYKSVRVPRHYFDKAESEDVLRLLNGTLQLVPLVKTLVDKEREKEKVKSLSGAIGAPSRLPDIPAPTDPEHRSIAVAHKLVATARKLHLIASALETQEAVVLKYTADKSDK